MKPRSECTCICHEPGSKVLHVMPCCYEPVKGGEMNAEDLANKLVDLDIGIHIDPIIKDQPYYIDMWGYRHFTYEELVRSSTVMLYCMERLSDGLQIKYWLDHGLWHVKATILKTGFSLSTISRPRLPMAIMTVIVKALSK